LRLTQPRDFLGLRPGRDTISRSRDLSATQLGNTNPKGFHTIRDISHHHRINCTSAFLTMSMQPAGDIPLLVTSENSSSERRITPSWTIGQLKARLEPVTGIPPLSQKLTLKFGSNRSVPIEAVDEETTQLAMFSLAPYAEIHVSRKFFSLASRNML
jgi:hypothetical protein